MANLVPLFVDKDTGKIIATGTGTGGGGGGGDCCEQYLVWTDNGGLRTLTGFVENDVLHLVRSANFNGDDLLELELASFTPTMVASPLPSASLNWDVPALGFNVSITNPDDYPSEYISSVLAITATTGTISPLVNFTAGTKTPTPGGGVDWTQQFTTGASGYMRPTSTTIAGGSVVGTVSFNVVTGSTEVPYSGTAPINITWVTPTLSVSLGALTGQTFLSTYPSTPYTLNVTGVTNVASVCAHDVTSIGGVVNNPTTSGTFTFSVPIHKDNFVGTTRRVDCETTFTRPSVVTGAQYIAVLNSSATVTSATFTYPSFYVWTASVAVVPTVTDVVSGSGFSAGVTQFGDQSKTFAGFITNSAAVPRAIWFAVKSTASQPTVFKTGASPTLLSDVAVTMGNSITLQPAPMPSGYVPVGYTLYGIILQPGNTYVSIS